MKNKQKEALEFLASSVISREPLAVLFDFPKGLSPKKQIKLLKRLLKAAAENITITKNGKLDKRKRDISDEMYPTNDDIFNSKEDLATCLINK